MVNSKVSNRLADSSLGERGSDRRMDDERKNRSMMYKSEDRITNKTIPNKPEELDNILNPLVKKWFFSKFKEFSLPQLYGVMEVHNKNNVLISAPTGATKTLTSFLAVLNELIDSDQKGILEDRVYCVYVSPLKALSNDISVNLLRPLQEMELLSGGKIHVRIGVRTGDTTAHEKAKMLRRPPHILITTPESLAISLTSSKFRECMRKVDWLIVDEIHALAENKRGVHMSLSIERLAQLSPAMARVGLSATISPLEEIAKFLVGYESGNEKSNLRSCKIVNVQFLKEMDLKVLCPTADLIDVSYKKMHDAQYNLLHNLIKDHRTTIIFTNTRSATERVIHNLKQKFPEDYKENIGAHHGSLGKHSRKNIEDRLRKGEMKVVVSSTSLELGIDIGYVDLVLLLGSPKSVARCLQRIGRSGHQLHSVTKGRIVVLDRDDLVECSVLLKAAIEKNIDRIHIPTDCLDVLAQQIAGIAVSDKIHIDELKDVVKRSYCYHSINDKDFMDVIDYLAGRYVALEDRHIYAKIWHDKESGMIGKRGKMSRVIFMTNVGTIPDETHVQVKIGEHIVGTIDEAFLEKLKKGDVFVLGGNTYEFKFARGMTAQVNASVNRPPTVPSWFSEMLPLSFDLAMQIGKFRRLVDEKMRLRKSEEEIISFINEYLYVDKNGAVSIYKYLREQYLFSEIPNDKKILIETFSDRGRTFFVFHTLFGRRVNDSLSRCVALAISKIQHRDVDIGITDNGFFISSPKKVQAINALKALKSDQIRKIAENAIDRTEILARRFRHCATRAMMILRNYLGRSKRVGRQQVSSMILLTFVKRIDQNFSILKEAKREVLEDLMDIENTSLILGEIEKGNIKIKELNTEIPSPFAFSLISQGYTDTLKIEDRVEFLRRMHQRVLEKIEGE